MGSTSGIWVWDQLVRARQEERLARSTASSALGRSRRAWRCPLRAAAKGLAAGTAVRPLTDGGRT